MTRTDELPPFEARLLAELTEVVEDRRRAATTDPAGAGRAPRSDGDVRPLRTRLAVATAGVAAAAVAIALAPGLVGDGGDPAYAVRELEGGLIEVRWDRDFDDGRALEAALREHGVDVEVRTVPATPSAVGRIYGMEAPDPGTEAGFEWGPDGGELAFTIDPDAFRGQVVLELAVDPQPGEPYQLAEEAFEPGEVLGGLHCALGEPIRSDGLAPYLDRLGLAVAWEVIGPSPDGDPDAALTVAVEERPDGEVFRAYGVDAGTIRVEVQRDDARLDPTSWPPRLSDVPCTEAQADAWR